MGVSNVRLARTSERSPTFLEEHSPESDLVQFHAFKSDTHQAHWLAEQIQHSLKADELQYDDIIVVNPDPLTTRGNTGPIRTALLDRGMMSPVAGVDTGADSSSNHRATQSRSRVSIAPRATKPAWFYVINAEESYDSRTGLALVRNRPFTAITRSKAWVRVLGVGPNT